MIKIEDVIQTTGLLDIVHPDMAALFDTDQVAYALTRRSGLGASDASVYLGVNLYQSVDELIAEKKALEYTDKEKAVGELEQVRKGRDLEPIILGKFSDKFNVPVHKPKPMYRIIAHPQLTINYDGMLDIEGMLIPVEAKFVTVYGAKYYDRNKCINNLMEGSKYATGGATIIDHITESANAYGIPAYYYTQVQQQMMGVDAPFAYMAVLFDKGWDFKTYKIYADAMTQQAIISESQKVWQRIRPL